MITDRMQQWTASIALLSLVMFVATLVLIPVLIATLPADYFTAKRRRPVFRQKRHPILFLLLEIASNLLGLVFALMGVIMLLTPGQGVLTILVGMTLMNYPGKYQAERWLISRRSVWRFTAWVRRKAGVAPLIHPNEKNRSSADRDRDKEREPT